MGILDTGATVSVLAEKFVESNNIPIANNVSNVVRLTNGEAVRSRVTQPLNVVINGRHCKMQFVIMPGTGMETLIGLDSFKMTCAQVDAVNTNVRIANQK